MEEVDTMDIKDTVLQVISSNTEIGKNIYSLGDEESLFDNGMDSLQMMRTIVEIEKTLNFKFRDEDLLTANFSSINSIVASVSSALSVL